MDTGRILKLFDKSDKSVSHVLETNFPLNSSNNLPYYDGIWTIKNNMEDIRSFNPEKHIPFMINDLNTFPGALEAEGNRVISFLGPKKKIIKIMSNSVYHLLADDISEMLYALKMYPDSELIISLGLGEDNIKTNPSWHFFLFFLNCLKKKKIKYYITNLDNYDLVYVENFYNGVFPFHTGVKFDIVSDFFKEFIPPTNEPNNKKVFVSRKMMPVGEDKRFKNFSYKKDERIDSHENLEKIFLDYGFEIVYPEDFSSFEEQVKYFSSVKTLASLTSSGIVNSLFMERGSNIIEIITPLLTISPMINDEYLKKYNFDPSSKEHSELGLSNVHEVHMFYHTMAFMQEMLYVGIPNYDRKSEKIKEFIENNPMLKAILESE